MVIGLNRERNGGAAWIPVLAAALIRGASTLATSAGAHLQESQTHAQRDFTSLGRV
jgi:hypothetical protein